MSAAGMQADVRKGFSWSAFDPISRQHQKMAWKREEDTAVVGAWDRIRVATVEELICVTYSEGGNEDCERWALQSKFS